MHIRPGAGRKQRVRRAALLTVSALAAGLLGAYLLYHQMGLRDNEVPVSVAAEAERVLATDLEALDLPPHGASSTGPASESCETEGMVIGPDQYPAAVAAAEPGSLVLLRGGTYNGGVVVPPGTPETPTTLKPYNCQEALIIGSVELSSRTVLAGLTLTSTDAFTVLIRQDSPSPKIEIVVRNNRIRGGMVEALRVARNVQGVDIVGNDLDGGLRRHVLKVHYESSDWSPKEVRIVNNRFQKTETGSGNDLLQLEGHESVLVMSNTFSNGASEHGLDIKPAGPGSSVTVTRNYFDGSSIEAACLLVQGDHALNIVEDNYFDHGCLVVLGAHPEDELNPWWRFEGNTIVNGTLQLRRSLNAEIKNNIMEGGTLKLGLEDGDYPRGAILTGNLFVGVSLLDRVTQSGDTFTCTTNDLIEVVGDWETCR